MFPSGYDWLKKDTDNYTTLDVYKDDERVYKSVHVYKERNSFTKKERQTKKRDTASYLDASQQRYTRVVLFFYYFLF